MKHPDIAVVSARISQQVALHGLLNCLIKEFALPLGAAEYRWPDNMAGSENTQQRQETGERPLYLRLPGERQFLVMVDRCDALGSQRYLSDVRVRFNNGEWFTPLFPDLVDHILAACGHITGHCNDELADQIRQSQSLVQSILQHNLSGEHPAPLSGYLASEQGLWFGHPSHPAPKARLWPAHLGQIRYAPEFQACTALHQFDVPLDGLSIGSDRLAPEQVLAGFADQSQARPGHAIIVMHPVQAWLFRQDERVRQLLASDTIIDLGPTGYIGSPTASIRTWYLPEHDYFIKGSLNVRITNCVRKNAWYELESTLIIDRLLHHLTETTPETLGGFVTAQEPGTLSWSPRLASEADRHWFREQTGAILRENFCRRFGEARCLLGGTLFARGGNAVPLIHGLFRDTSGQEPDDDQLLRWFSDYQARLLSPVLSLFFNHGIVLEPHLQNSVVIHRNGWPEQVLLRDFEGVKLTAEQGIHQVDVDMHPRVRQSLLYSREQGWNRICYCLFVNNLAEAVLALTWSRPWLTARMWQRVRMELIHIRDRLKGDAPELDAIIEGHLLACKTNLRVRMAADADRQAGYVHLRSPWQRPEAEHE
ncbi:IucA/IucC family protein [Xenorhabdus doucetiae]|uniref:Achromobactin biosynthetic and transport gene acsD n=1 Tax=Xenorhabdus doucetiae TaxID=351671 RepID=A0A068QSP6_9GAMM|nr:IucA/IucC family protein [Xenorhabdus doucetiae]TYP11594.1 siderophore synthetase component [Xenorhabdus doucetiae]CDG17661.1 Achromobactin biosynthetic and transport gene acsD [Xenorhabdus doucetiae]